MTNRIKPITKSKKVNKINTFFLACEFKPKTYLFKREFEDFAYDIQPAFTYGMLGILSYKPKAYTIIHNSGSKPIFGYTMTISNPDTINLLDKIKGFYGANTFNYHIRILAHAFTSPSKVLSAWAYTLSDQVIGHFEAIEEVEYMWDEEDKDLFNYFDKIV